MRHLVVSILTISAVITLVIPGCNLSDDELTGDCDTGTLNCVGESQIQQCGSDAIWGEATDCPEEEVCVVESDGLTHCVAAGTEDTAT